MKENSIERDIHLLESYAGMTHKMTDNQGRPKLDQAIERILKDYKRALKENEGLKEDRDKFKKALGRRITYCNELEKDLFENSSNYVIKKQKVKDKIEELKKKVEELTNDKGYWGGSDLLEQIKVLQELLREE